MREGVRATGPRGGALAGPASPPWSGPKAPEPHPAKKPDETQVQVLMNNRSVSPAPPPVLRYLGLRVTRAVIKSRLLHVLICLRF